MFIINLYLVVTSHCISDWYDENVSVCMLDFVCVCVWLKYRWGGGGDNQLLDKSLVMISDLNFFLEDI